MGLGKINPGCGCGCEDPPSPPCSPCGQPEIFVSPGSLTGDSCTATINAIVRGYHCGTLYLDIYRNGTLIRTDSDSRHGNPFLFYQLGGQVGQADGIYTFVARTECGQVTLTCIMDGSILKFIYDNICDHCADPVPENCVESIGGINYRPQFPSASVLVSGLTGWLAGLNGTYSLDGCGIVSDFVEDAGGPAPFTYRIGRVSLEWTSGSLLALVETRHSDDPFFGGTGNPQSAFGLSGRGLAKVIDMPLKLGRVRTISCTPECCEITIQECGAVTSTSNSYDEVILGGLNPSDMGSPRGIDAALSWI